MCLGCKEQVCTAKIKGETWFKCVQLGLRKDVEK